MDAHDLNRDNLYWYQRGNKKPPIWISEAPKTSPSGAAFWKLNATSSTGEKPKPKEIFRQFRYGINLRRVNLSGSNLTGTNLQRADLTEANLVQAILNRSNMWACVLDHANLWSATLTDAYLAKASLYQTILSQSNLEGADLAYADLQEADLSRSKLKNVTFFGADLADSDLTGANIEQASFWKADIQGSRIDATIVTQSLLQEDVNALTLHLEHHMGMQDNSHHIPNIIGRRFLEARDVYLALKANFTTTGNNQAASAAHFRARQCERKTHHPAYARFCYHKQYTSIATKNTFSRLNFYAVHIMKWLLDWGAELICGYGERPLRVVACSGMIIVLFTFLYYFSGGIIDASGTVTSWTSYFQYSLATFCTISFPNLAPANNVTMALSSIEAFLGISCLALLMFALGNRISRS